jgi:prephenate dehydrogenase
MVAFPGGEAKKKIDSGRLWLYLLEVARATPFACKALFVKSLRKITIIGLGLLGGSVALAVRQRMPGTAVLGYSHRPSTRRRAKALGVVAETAANLQAAVAGADLILLATPIFTFERYFADLSGILPPGCIVTDVGSTKVLPHEWAEQRLGDHVCYVGSHPVAGSEQRGVEFARDDLFDQTRCILTTTTATNRGAVRMLKSFWSVLGCSVRVMSPAEHDRVFANISHLPHVMAAGLVNASDEDEMLYAGKGFLDSTRIASGPPTVWTDVLLANRRNVADGLDRAMGELSKLRAAIATGEREQIEQLLEAARRKRAKLVKYKIRKKELPS